MGRLHGSLLQRIEVLAKQARADRPRMPVRSAAYPFRRGKGGEAAFVKKLFKFLTHRVTLVGVSILLQALILILSILEFRNYFVYFYALSMLLSLAIVLGLVNGNSNPGYKIAWIVPILLFPIFGGVFYLLLGGNHMSKRAKRKMQNIQRQTANTLRDNDALIQRVKPHSPSAAGLMRYVQKYAYCPPWENTATKYYALGELAFADMKAELRRAKRYIFLEYFIVEHGTMWDEILEILRQKVAEGVDVRMIYDDLGCVMTLPYRYDRQLEAMGIKCCVFNPFMPVLNSHFNHRDHRKILVIDGDVAFTGGINLADEYINAYPKHGHWKDTAILLRGAGAWNLTVLFLSMWDYLRGSDEDLTDFQPEPAEVHAGGVVQPFADNPLDEEAVSQTVYLHLINTANRYVYINTPYLVIDNETVVALTSAAKRGVDVRIITPHIPDKWFVHAVTRANYEVLVQAGVRIYEYMPGFNHAKTFAVDDELGVVGTINMDYRSLYLHFECGVLLYGTDTVRDVRDDFLQTVRRSQIISLADCRSVKWYQKWGRALLRMFAPLM